MQELANLPEQLRDLAGRVRAAARASATGAREGAREFATPAPVGQGAGDVTFALDQATEAAVDSWFEERASDAPLSLLTEDRGWRHRGPGGELDGFDHGGPRIVIDPVDGTRHLMADLRSAWTVIAACAPGAGEPLLADVELGICTELCDSRAARYRYLSAERGRGARLELRELEGDAVIYERALTVDDDDRPDHGYFSVFRYTPAMRPRLAEIEARFFALLAEHELADTRSCYDDQYISNGGQLVLLTLGTYRMIADLRAQLAPEYIGHCAVSKPYDSAGALLIAREAGCVITDARGAELDFPLDATTPVSFVGWANAGSATRLARHLVAALDQLA
jgi:fructose-1,6-bisphosphatase/inositol monophosphatase family enzyme